MYKCVSEDKLKTDKIIYAGDISLQDNSRVYHYNINTACTVHHYFRGRNKTKIMLSWTKFHIGDTASIYTDSLSSLFCAKQNILYARISPYNYMERLTFTFLH